MLAPTDVAYSLRKVARSTAFRRQAGHVVEIDPDAVTTADGQTYQGDYLVLAAGSQPNFFHTPGAEEHAFPLSLDDATRLRARILTLFEEVDGNGGSIEDGALTSSSSAADRPASRRPARWPR